MDKHQVRLEGQRDEGLAVMARFLQLEPMVRGPQDFFRLQRWFREGERQRVRRILKQRANRMISAYMKTFGSRRGPVPMQDPLLFYVLGLYKRKSGKSWSELAKMVNRSRMREDPTKNSVQQAVKRANVKVQAQRAKNNRNLIG